MSREQQVAAYQQAQLLAQYQQAQQQQAQAQQRQNSFGGMPVAAQQQQQYQQQQAQQQYGMGMQRNLSGGLAPQSGGLNLGAARMGNSFGAMPQQAMPQQGMPQSSYNPSNEILAMINKGHMGLPQGVPQPNVQGLAQAGLQGLGMGAPGDLGGAAFPPLGDADFPSLGQRPGGAPGVPAPGLARQQFPGLQQVAAPPPPPPQQEFNALAEDFPALPGAAPAAPAPAPSGGGGGGFGGGGLGGGGLGDLGLGEKPAGGGGDIAEASERYGLMGLLSVIRMTDQDLSTLALGTDLTTLGLNLNSSDCLYATFASPWADANVA